MRKLAREAVIFALLGMLLAVIGAFVTLDSGARSTARSEAAKAVHAACVSCVIKTIAGVEPWNRLWLKVPLSDGTVLDVLVCEPSADIDDVIKDKDFLSAPQNKQIEYVSDIDPDFAKASHDRQLEYLAYITGKTHVRPRWTPWQDVDTKPSDQNKDCRKFPFTQTQDYKKYGLVPASIQLGNTDQVSVEKDYWAAYRETRRRQLLENAMASAFIVLYGFPAGIGFWIFYRLVRFAVRG